jgi:uncharacterized membrane protein YfcA
MIPHWILYLLGGFLTGSINSIAGGGALVLFPLLIGAGVPAVMANTTMSLAVLPGSLSSAYGYRKHIEKLPKRYFMLLIPCFIGSLTGAILLLDTSGRIFKLVAPLFMVGAIVLLMLQPKIHKRLYNKKKAKVLTKHHFSMICIVGLVFLVLSAYGGYFGAGFGIIVLSLLALTPIKDIQQMNGLKNCIGISVGIADGGYFIHRHVVDVHILPFLVIGGIAGGYLTSTYGSKLPAAKLRVAIIILASIVTVYLTYKFYAGDISQAQALAIRWYTNA